MKESGRRPEEHASLVVDGWNSLRAVNQLKQRFGF